MTLEKFNLYKLSVVIHYRKDSQDRENNLKTVLKFLDSNFLLERIIVVNDDKELDPNVKGIIRESVKDNRIDLLFMENTDHFKKSLAFNVGSGLHYGLISDVYEGAVLAFWDVDVILRPEDVVNAYNIIQEGIADHVYPFNGTFIDVQPALFEENYTKDTFQEWNELWLNRDENLHFAADESPGGCTLISEYAFVKMKGYDERFIGWGFEDTDFRNRSKRVNTVKYLGDPQAICWHLHHEQAVRMENPHFYQNMNIYNNNISQ